MSSMLEQAIVDANALREAAIKTAESNLVEKYSEQIKEAVETLLEQPEDPMSAMFPPPDAGMPPAVGMPPGPVDPGASSDSAIENIPLAATEGEKACPCPEEQEIYVVALDDLAQQAQAMDPGVSPEEVAMMGQEVPPEMEPEPGAPPLVGEGDLYTDADLFGEWEFPADMGRMQTAEEPSRSGPLPLVHGIPKREIDPYTGEREPLEKYKARVMNLAAGAVERQERDRAVARHKKPAGMRENTDVIIDEDGDNYIGEQDLDEYDLTEEEMSDLLEALKVDLSPESLRAGWSHGMPDGPEKEEAKDLAVAREQDDEVKEENEALRDAVESLQEANEQYKNVLNRAQKQLDKYEKKLVKTKEIAYEFYNKLEEATVKNARLLYTNKVLLNDSLNERQKTQIVENINKAKNVEEAKTIHETLQSAVGSTVKSTNKQPQSLSEVMRRSSTTMLPRHKEVKANDPSVSNRWKVLAGIDK